MNNTKIQFAISGRKVEAIYQESEIPSYNNNPLIEALPPILSDEEVMEDLTHYPNYNEDMKFAPNNVRFHLIQNDLRFFSPLDVHLDLERRISCMLRVGYTDRNPTEGNIWNRIEKSISEISPNTRSQYGTIDDFKSTSAFGFGMVGISGIGKSQTIERIIKLYPQVIYHNSYNGQNFTQTQLVWLKIDCPFDGSLKGLCYLFFQSVDNLLGTDYYEKYARTARSTDDIIPNLARVAANHFIGVLVIDEIQRLSSAKSGGEQKMLDFFIQLVNTIGIPTLLVGTYKALPILSGSIAQMRRAAGQGDLVWNRMQFDEQWQLLIEDLWEFQYLHNTSDLKKDSNLSKVLYEESQGITDLAIKLFMFSQELAITSGQEKLTASIIRSAAKTKFKLLRPILEAFKNNQKNALAKFEDAYPKYLNDDSFNFADTKKIVGEIQNEPEIKISMKNKIEEENTENIQDSPQPINSENQLAIDEFFKRKVIRHPKKSKQTMKDTSLSQKVLLNIFNLSDESDSKDVYEELCKQNFVRSSGEFLNKDHKIFEEK